MRRRLFIAARSERFPDDDPRWRSQTSDLHLALRRQVDGFEIGTETAPNAKGGVETASVLVAGATVVTALGQVLRAWLERDRTRSVEITRDIDGKTETWTLRADAMDRSSLQAFMDGLWRSVDQEEPEDSA